jgi:Tfp pilus assembly protein PilV
MRNVLRSVERELRALREAERGFTLIEALAAVVLLTWGLLVLLDVMPRGLRLGELANDQGRATALALQKLEYYKSLATSSLGVGDYGTRAECFDQNGNLLSTGSTCTTAVSNQQATYARDTQIQYWTWNASANKFTNPTPYTAPTGCQSACPSGTLYRVSVATYWYVRGQGAPPPGTTVFQTGATSGCVVGGAAAPMGIGCIQVSTFIAP